MSSRWLSTLREAADTCGTIHDLSQRVMPLLLDRFGGHTGAFLHFAAGGPVYSEYPARTASPGQGAAQVRDYLDHHARDDPFLAQNSRRNLEIDIASDQLSLSDASRSGAVTDFYWPRGFGDWMCARLGDSPVNQVGFIGLHMMRERYGMWHHDEVVKFRPTYEYLRKVARRIERVHSEHNLLAAVLNAVIREPTVVFDRHGDTRWLSATAEARFGRSLYERVPDPIRRAAITVLSDPCSGEATVHLGATTAHLRRVGEAEGAVVIARLWQQGTIDVLPEREWQVVLPIANGTSQKQVAYDLGIAPATVRVLLSRAMTRLGVGSARELAKKILADGGRVTATSPKSE